jgi:acyl-CoA synthetase (AMP-forming)/AMP-acid ligase II
VPQRDKKWGEIVTAWIAPLNITENSMKEALRGKLQDYEIPRKWHFVNQLPPLEKG